MVLPLEEVADAVASYTRRSRRPNLDGLRKNVRLGEDGRWRWHWDPRLVGNALDVDITPPIPVEDLLTMSRRITVPTLIVRGGKTHIVSPEAVEELRRYMPQASTVEVAGTGHMVAGDDNDSFTRAVVTFLTCCRRVDTAADRGIVGPLRPGTFGLLPSAEGWITSS